MAATTDAHHVVVLESPNLDPELEATISELLGRIQLTLLRRDAQTSTQPVARVWVEPFGEATRVSVENGRDKRLLIQRQVPPAATPALYRETVAHIIFSAVDALNSTPRDAPPAPPNPPPAAKVDRPTVAIRTAPPPAQITPLRSGSGMTLKLGARSGPRLVTNSTVALGFTGAATLVMGETLRPAATLEAGYVLPTHSEQKEVTSEFQMIPIRARFGLSPVRGDRLSLETSLGFGIDVVSLQARGMDDEVRATPETRRVQPLLESGIAVRWRISSAIALLLATGIDLDLHPRRWLYEQEQANAVLLETARFRPFAVLGFDYSIWSSKRVTEARGTP